MEGIHNNRGPEDLEFWRIISDEAFTSMQATPEATQQRLNFEVNQVTVNMVNTLMQHRPGLSLTAAVNGLLAPGILLENYLLDNAILRARTLDMGLEVPYEYNQPLPVIDAARYPAKLARDGQTQTVRSMNVTILPQHRAGIMLFAEARQCSEHVATNALIQRGYNLNVLLLRNAFVEVVDAETGQVITNIVLDKHKDKFLGSNEP